jgi:hypothetical protein
MLPFTQYGRKFATLISFSYAGKAVFRKVSFSMAGMGRGKKKFQHD